MRPHSSSQTTETKLLQQCVAWEVYSQRLLAGWQSCSGSCGTLPAQARRARFGASLELHPADVVLACGTQDGGSAAEAACQGDRAGRMHACMHARLAASSPCCMQGRNAGSLSPMAAQLTETERDIFPCPGRND